MGKASKRRMCPAVGRDISPAECGENRGSRYACPADCPHNPFAPANYYSLLRIDDALNAKTVPWLLADAPDPEAMKRAVQQAMNQPSGHSLHAFIAWHLFFRRDGAGQTCAERWQRAGFPGLKNDERVLLYARMQTRVALMEVRRVLDHERLEAVDLLAAEPVPVLFQDRSLSSQAVRFSVFLGWVFPLPHFWRLAGTAISLPDWEPFEPVETVTELVRHLGGPTAEPELRRWLAEHFVRFDTALKAVGLSRRAQMIASVDAQFGKATYDLQAPFAGCRVALDSASAVAEDALTPEEEQEGFLEARVWFADEAAPTPALPAGGRMVLGRVLLGQRRWRIEASSAARQAKLRQRFEGQLGERVKFVSESRDDLASRFALKEPAFDRSLVPPRFLEQPLKIEMASTRVPISLSGRSAADCEAELRLAADREFPDCPIPALDGRTPRAAAGDQVLRPRLVRLVKTRIRDRDEFNLRTGRTDDINWLPRELGLDELVIEPPPLRPRPVPAEDVPEEPVLATFDLSPAPPLPAEPLTLEQASERLRDSLSRFETESEAIESLEASGSTLLDDIGDLTEGLLNDAEFDMLLPFLLQTWFALVPPETRAPELTFGDLVEALHRILQALGAAVEDEEALKRFPAGCRQPALTQSLMTLVLEATSDSGKRITRKGRTLMTLVLVAVVDRLDQALRRGPATAD